MSSSPGKWRAAIFGSCISRDAFTFAPPQHMQVVAYVARHSFVGVRDAPASFEPEWYAALPAFEQRCLMHDLAKTGLAEILEAKADCVILDFIDERFDLLQVGPTRLSSTRQLLQDGFLQRHGAAMQRLPRLSEAVHGAWQDGARNVLQRLSERFGPDRVLLNAGRWSTHFRDETGLHAFEPPLAGTIAAHNRRLSTMFDEVRAQLPAAPVFVPAADDCIADRHHKWSFEPFHYTSRFYVSFSAWLDEVASRSTSAPT